MYQTSEEVAAAILSYSRTWRIRLEEVGGDTIIDGNEISQASSEHTSTSQPDDIELGAVCAQHWTVLASRSGDYVGKQFLLYLYLIDLDGVNTTWGDLENYTVAELSHWRISELQKIIGSPIPMGVFTCVKAPRTGDGRELHLYDAIYFTDKPYRPQINLPALASAVEKDICTQLGVETSEEMQGTGGFVEVRASQSHRVPGFLQVNSGGLLYTSPFDFTIDEIPEGATMREMLGYIAALHAQFGCIDRDGKYTRRWYATQSLATIDSDHANEPTVSETQNVIVGLKCTAGDVEYRAGAESGGRVLEFTNPFMTQTMIRSLFVKVGGMTWYTAQLTERLGDPRHDIGDTVTIQSNGTELDIPVTMMQFDFDGGLLANISAVGVTDEEQSL